MLDPDGVKNTLPPSQVILTPFRSIFRSVGPDNSNPLASGGGNNLTISGGVASFSTNLNADEDIGVGDAIQYDSNNDGSVDSIIFIHFINDSQNFVVKTADGLSPDDMTTVDNDWEIFRAYTDLASAENAVENTSIDPSVRDFDSWSGGHDLYLNNLQWNLALYADNIETDPVIIDGWNTSAEHFLKIYTPYLESEVFFRQRHEAVYNEQFSALKVGASESAIQIRDDNVIIEGLQIVTPNTTADSRYAILIDETDHTGTNIKNNLILESDPTGSSRAGIFIRSLNQGVATLQNNIIYGHTGSDGKGIHVEAGGDNGKFYVNLYNNTVVSNQDGIHCSLNDCRCVNNISSVNTSTDFSPTTSCDPIHSDKNISSDSSSPSEGLKNKVVNFLDTAHLDFRLNANDLEAKNKGLNLSSIIDDLDIVGHQRGSGSTWDIGAFEAANVLYRSIGSANTTPLAVGTGNNLSITNSIANFASSLSENIGIGDALEYDSNNNGIIDSIAFIHQRIDSQNYLVATSNGENVSDIGSPDQDWKIFRAYTNLDNVDNTIENTSIDLAVSDFDNGNRTNLVLENTQMNLALYADGVEDAWSPQNWITAGTNKLKLLAPSSSSEVGISQRHKGVWDETKSRIVDSDYFALMHLIAGQSINIRAFEVEGIQFKNSYTGVGRGAGIWIQDLTVPAQYTIRDNIISKTVEQRGEGIFFEGDEAKIKIINNIIYDFANGIDLWSRMTFGRGSIFYVANNTVYNSSGSGFNLRGYGTDNILELINNISQGGGVDYNYGSIFENLVRMNNISSDATAVGTGSQTSVTLNFIDASRKDFRLGIDETNASGNGVDLSNNPNFLFSTDIKGNVRSQWDIGAFSYLDYSLLLTEFDEIGDGSSSNPYQIFSKAQLKDIGEDLSDGCNSSSSNACASVFSLYDNIDLNNETFTPIGDASNSFSGSFEGNNKIISALSINNPGSGRQGLFGQITGASISDLIISGSVIGQGSVGLLVGLANGGTVTNVHTSGLVNCSGTGAGGLVGRSNGASILNSSSSADVSGGTCFSVGGLVGYNDNGDIDNSWAEGEVTGFSNVGGLLGAGGNIGSSLSSNYATGDVFASHDVGGLIGTLRDGDLIDSFATGTVSSSATTQESDAGGLVGVVTNSTNPISINDCYSLSDVFAKNNRVGGLVGHMDNTDGTRFINRSWAAGDVKTNGSSVGGLVGENSSQISDSFAMGDVWGESSRAGGFIGNHATLSINRSYATGDVYLGESGLGYSGGFIGYMSGSVSDSYATGNVYSALNNSGGFIGLKSGGQVIRSFATGNIYSEGNNIGGFVGQNQNSVLRESYALGNVVGNSNIGGFVGLQTNGTSQNSYSAGNVSGVADIGGFAGQVDLGNIINNYTRGDVVGGGTNSNAFIGNYVGGTLTANYWNQETTSEANGIEGTASTVNQFEPLTTAQFNDDSNFDSAQSGSWDYTNTWTQLNTRGYPIHKEHIEGQCLDNLTAQSYNLLGSGSVSDPYVICNSAQLNDFALNGCNDSVSVDCDKYFTLGSDIDLQDKDVELIAGFDSNPFSGGFDGRNKSIKNFKKSFPSNSHLGLFRSLSGVIKNVKIKNSYLEGTNDVGTLVAESIGGKVLNSKVEGDFTILTNANRVGGLVGDVSEDSIFSHLSYVGNPFSIPSNTAGVIGEDSTIGGEKTYLKKIDSYLIIEGSINNVGGILGKASGDNTIISKSKASGEILSPSGSGTNNGGITGLQGTIRECLSTVSIVGSNLSGVGGVSGAGSAIINSHSKSSIINADYNVGGIQGNGSDITNSYSELSSLLANSSFGGVHGNGNSFNITRSFWDSDLNGITTGENPTRTEGKTSAELKQQATFVGWDFENVWAIDEGVRSPKLRWNLHPECQANMSAMTYNAIGSGSAIDPYKICFKEQLLDLSISGCDSDSSAGCSSFYLLLNDIDLKGETFAPIGTSANVFSGYFNGNNHTISNLYINEPTRDNIGLFGWVDSSAIVLENLNLVLVDVTGRDCVGGFAGQINDGIIKNVHFSGSVQGEGRTGGAFGCLSGTVYQSSAKGNVSQSGSAGNGTGVFSGTSTGSIYNSHAYGSVSSSSSDIGGFVGGINGTSSKIYDSSASVVVNSTGSNVGGFVGGARGNSNIQRCFSLGDVESGSNQVAGFIGLMDNSALAVNNFSLGSVSASGADVGGFVGRVNSSTNTIRFNYSAANSLSGVSFIHAFAGNVNASATVERNYWDNDLLMDTGDGVRFNGLTTLEMQDSSNFISWDFSNTWRILLGQRPELILNND